MPLQLPDEGLDVEFSWGSGLDREKMTELRKKLRAETGDKDAEPPAVYKDVPWVRIIIPGNKDEIIHTEAWIDLDHQMSHPNRFPNAWARFKARDHGGQTGFSIRDWAAINRSVADTFHANNIKTVEQLAALSDGNLQRIPLPDTYALRAKAQMFMAQQQSTGDLRAELDALKAKLAGMANVTVQPATPGNQIQAAAAMDTHYAAFLQFQELQRQQAAHAVANAAPGNPVLDEVAQAIGAHQPPEVAAAVTLAIESESKPRRGRRPRSGKKEATT